MAHVMERQAGTRGHTCTRSESSLEYTSKCSLPLGGILRVPSSGLILFEPEPDICTLEDCKADFKNIPSAGCLRIEPEYTCVYESRNGIKRHSQRRSKASQGWLECDAPFDVFTNSKREKHEAWRYDVGQRYKELIPPGVRTLSGANKKQRGRSSHTRLSAEDLRKAAEAALSRSDSFSWTPQGQLEAPVRTKVEEAVLVLDLDKCSFYGSDGNDLGIALQWMEKGPELVLELYRLLLNPQVKATYARLQERAKHVRVVIYTMRATFLLYHSCFRDMTMPLRWSPPWHHGAQLFIPPSADAEAVMRSYSMRAPLLEDERRDLKKSFERLLSTRTVIAEELQLDTLPELVITASPKDVEGTMRRLGKQQNYA
jgi:hypothetical protein